ncbi:hypothetical protein G8C92_28385 [Paenibacillus donghaensis]|uniref:hypothetical protein n=1 Tax=Paenibacillus donghaensis TaxID=414771 RepID=UPI001883259B|nr:hypothetical protein [Paenibacillus donghaensis]MBE9917922.1 hypothetical protein [Paenibacillus donghaensis]
MKTRMKITVAALSGALLLGSMDFAAAAAPSHTVSKIGMKTTVLNTKGETEGEKLEKAEQERIAQLLKKNPDATYMVYVSKEVTKQKADKVYSMGNPFPKFDSYEAYQKKASTLKGTVLQQPAALPEGYKFVAAGIAGPYSTEYTKEMEAEAKKLGKKIYSKKVDWTDANEITIEYSNGKHTLTLGYKRLDPKQPVKQEGYVYESAAEVRKKYPKLGKEYINNTLSWAVKGKQFAISTDSESPLTKEELIKLAKTMVKK